MSDSATPDKRAYVGLRRGEPMFCRAPADPLPDLKALAVQNGTIFRGCFVLIPPVDLSTVVTRLYCGHKHSTESGALRCAEREATRRTTSVRRTRKLAFLGIVDRATGKKITRRVCPVLAVARG